MATVRQNVLEAVKLLEVATTLQIEEIMPEVPRTSISRELGKLWKSGTLIRSDRVIGRKGFSYQLNPDPKRKPDKNTIAAAAAKSAARPTGAGLQARLDEALLRITELEAWKAAAIAKHPNLGVDPEVLEARRIIAKVYRDSGDAAKAKDAETGQLDHTPVMRVALAALGG